MKMMEPKISYIFFYNMKKFQMLTEKEVSIRAFIFAPFD